MPIFETRGILEGSRAPQAVGDRTDVWWVLLDCGCTNWCPYDNGPCRYTRMHCPKHPLAADPAPKQRGTADGEAWMADIPEPLEETD